MQSGVGETLRRERVSRELTLDQISHATRISSRFLQAIEKEDFGSLPGVIFVRNFIKQYAAFLDMDPEPLLAMVPRFDLESAPMPRPPDRPRRPFWDPRWNSTVATISWTLLAAGASVGAYIHFNHRLVSAAALTASQQPPAQKPAPTVTPVSVPVPTPTSSPEAPAVDTAALAGHAVQVVLAAKEESWVQAIADGKSVFTGMLKPGETRSIGADDRVKVRTGNAGGIEISLNGKALDPLGPVGQVRSVMLTAAGPQLPPGAPPVESSPF